jgi:hypothetical protein
MAFKMKGWSAFKKETNLPEEEQQRITDKKDALAKEAWDKYGATDPDGNKLSWEEKKKQVTEARKNNPKGKLVNTPDDVEGPKLPRKKIEKKIKR